MKRLSLIAGFALLVSAPVAAAPLTPAQRDATIRYVSGLQNPDGGFRPSATAAPSQVSAVTVCLRALRYLGKPADRRRKEAALRFVQTCEHQNPATFSDLPAGEPAVLSTAMGILALAECRGNGDAPERAFLEANAHTLPELYMAEASLDAVHVHPSVSSRWVTFFQDMRKPDGSYGSGAYDTATAVISLLRLNAAVKDREAVARIIEAAQQPDGGFATAGGRSDLPTTYRMMRALFMLKALPSLTRLQGFIDRCRNADGGYGVSPGQPSTATGTYNAAIVMYWSNELQHGK